MRKFHVVKSDMRKNEEEPILPRRATQGSAGYDFYLPYDVFIKPKSSKLIWTDIKVEMEKDEVFELYVRSSYGIKKNLMLANTIGIIDCDYFGNEKNDGNTGVCLYNYGDEGIYLNKEDAFCQGVFKKYYVTDDDEPVTNNRKGGIGSTS